jgi:hypothetical protein
LYVRENYLREQQVVHLEMKAINWDRRYNDVLLVYGFLYVNSKNMFHKNEFPNGYALLRNAA